MTMGDDEIEQTVSAWCSCGWSDHAYLKVAGALRRMIKDPAAEPAGVQVNIPNTVGRVDTEAGSRGSHWFTVAFSIERRPQPQQAQTRMFTDD